MKLFPHIVINFLVCFIFDLLSLTLELPVFFYRHCRLYNNFWYHAILMIIYML
jgi:hypothetical protein